MKRRAIISVLLALQLVLCGAWPVTADTPPDAERPSVASPFPGDPYTPMLALRRDAGPRLAGGLGSADIATAATWLLVQQQPAGWFPWQPGGGIPPNTQGTTARGLLKAYVATGTPSHRAGMLKAGDYMVSSYPKRFPDGDPEISSHDPLFLDELSQVTGAPQYAAFTRANFWAKLTAGAYGAANNQDAAAWTAAVVNARRAYRPNIVDLAPWDLSAAAIAAHRAGEFAARDAIMLGVHAGLQSMPTPSRWYDVLGLAGAVWASAVTGVALHPTAGAYVGLDTAGLAARLAAYQRSSGTWASGTYASTSPEDRTEDSSQTTAFALLALSAHNSTLYGPQIAAGRVFIARQQQPSGQILEYPGAASNYSGSCETHAEAMSALVESATQFSFEPLTGLLCVGENRALDIVLHRVTNLYGYQFQVLYDPALVSAAGAFANSFFDTAGGSIPPAWNAQCADGACQFAVSKMAPGAAVDGSGAVARVTFTGLAPAGVVAVTFANAILTDRNGNALPHDLGRARLEICGWATAQGRVSLQGRATPVDAGTVTLTDAAGSFVPTTVGFDPLTGDWSATVRVQAGGSAYAILAAHGLYLGNSMNRTLNPGGICVAPDTRLRGGDAYADGIDVNISDLACIAGSFGGAPMTCGAGSNDINADGVVNILDLAIAGGNYGLTGAQAWQ